MVLGDSARKGHFMLCNNKMGNGVRRFPTTWAGIGGQGWEGGGQAWGN